MVFSLFCTLVGRPMKGAIAPHLLATLLFLIRPFQKPLYNKFFNLINAIQINKIRWFSSFLLQKSHLVNFRQRNYLHLRRMLKNDLHRTLIFILPKVYSVQVFVQHTVSSVRRILERGGAGNSENLRITKTRIKIFPLRNSSVFPSKIR